MELQRHALEKKELQEKVTKLELELQHQKERFDDMKYDLRDVKREKEGGGKPIIVSTCVLL
jgi:predicted  nucleic acid-binding Zn-ribbon protein